MSVNLNVYGVFDAREEKIYDKQNVEKKTYRSCVGGRCFADCRVGLYADIHHYDGQRQLAYCRGGDIVRGFGGMCGGGNNLHSP